MDPCLCATGMAEGHVREPLSCSIAAERREMERGGGKLSSVLGWGGGGGVGRCDQQVAEKEAKVAEKGRDDKEYMAWLLASHEQRHRVDTAEETVRRMVARQQAADNMAEVEAKAERKVQERLMELEQDATEQYNTYHRCGVLAIRCSVREGLRPSCLDLHREKSVLLERSFGSLGVSGERSVSHAKERR